MTSGKMTLLTSEPQPPIGPLSRAEVRDVDRLAIADYGLPGVVLMENAGRNAAALLAAQSIGGPVAIACGKGNNAGDGFVIARHLQNLGCNVCVLLAFAPADYTGDASINLHVVQSAGIPCVDLSRANISEWERHFAAAHWIVDALLGTGLTGTVRPPLSDVIDAINRAAKPVLAVDLPSGMDADTGQPLGTCVRATLTATFVAEKIGFHAPGAIGWTGPVHVLDIGIPQRLRAEIAQRSRGQHSG